MLFIRRMGITVHFGWLAWFTSTASALLQLMFKAALGWYFHEGNGVVWCHLNKTESWNTIFLYFLRDKKRFVLKTLSRLKSINVFYLGTSSEDEIIELHRLTETSQIPQKPGYPIPQDHHFGITWGAALAGWGSAQETCCQEQQGPFGSVLSDAQPWQPLHIWTQQLLGLPGTACFVSRSWPELAKLILLDCPPLRSLNNHSSRKKKEKKKSMFLTGAARLCPCTLSCRCVCGELLSLKLSGNYFFFFHWKTKISSKAKFSTIAIRIHWGYTKLTPYRTTGQFEVFVVIFNILERFF